MRVFLLFLLGLISVAHADDSAKNTQLPPGCVAVEVKYEQNGTVRLGGQADEEAKQRLFLFQNQLSHDLLIDPVLEEPAASAGWSTRLQPSKWSALVLGRTHLEFSCIEQRPGAMQYIDCEQVVTVCQIPKVKLAQSGSYWLAENQSLTEMKQVLNFSLVD